MSSLPSLDDWKRRFKAHVVSRLVDVGGWTEAEAEEAAQNELDNVHIDLSDEPEASADEALSYWGDGV